MTKISEADPKHHHHEHTTPHQRKPATTEQTPEEMILGLNAPEQANLASALSSVDVARRAGSINKLQQQVGNTSVRRVLSKTPKVNNQPGSGATEGHVPVGLQPLGTRPLPEPTTDEVREAIQKGRERSGVGSSLGKEDRPIPEQASAQDFGGVRLHVDRGADQVTSVLGARAATIGSDIYVASDQYRPGTTDFQRLLAHELTHVAQTGGREGEGPLVGNPRHEPEREANRAEGAVPIGRAFSARPITAIPYVQPQLRPLPTGVVMTFPTPLDPGPVNDFCRDAAGEATNQLGSAGSIWDNTGLGGQVTQIFQSRYFEQGNTSWVSNEVTWDPGPLYCYFSARVEIRLLEDAASVRQLGAGPEATVGSTSGVSTTTGTSTSTQTGVSGTAGGKVTGGPAEVSAGGTVSTQTTVGTTGGITMGGSATGQQASPTIIYESNVYAEAKVYVRAWQQIFGQRAAWNRSRTIQVGTARYSRATLLPVAAPGVGGGR